MSRSVPRNIDRKGEHLSRCDVCSVPYLRSALRRCDDGLLRCAEDLPGRNAVTLAMLTAARPGLRAPPDGAFPDVDSNGQPSSNSSYTGPVSRRTVADVYFTNGIPTYDDPGTLVDKDGF